MDIDHSRRTVLVGMRPQRLADQRTDGQIWNIMIVHHIEMDEIRPRFQDVLYLLSQAREIRRKDAWCNAIIGHDVIGISSGIAV